MKRRLTESQIGAVFNSMPGGPQGFLIDWGYMQFARAIENAILGPELDEDGRDALSSELQWAIANNEDRPRTGLALQWALDALNEIEEGENV